MVKSRVVKEKSIRTITEDVKKYNSQNDVTLVILDGCR